MTSKPNVLVFFTDQQRWDSSGLHGNPLDLMPNFDRVATAGTHLYNAYSPQPVCGPCRSCFQTGMYATTSGCVNNWSAHIGEHKTLAHFFKDAGYETGYIGKWHLARGRQGAVEEELRGGYDYWLASNVLEFTSNAYDTCLYNNNNEEVKLPGYRVDAMADATIRYIDEKVKEDKPFFLFTSYIEPHHQNHRDDYPAPDGYEERYRNKWVPPDLAALGGSTQQHIAGYYGMIKRLDEAFGRVMDSLKSLGQLENTIVLFTTDHGNHFKTRNSEYKRSCHDASTRLPSMITGPGFTGKGQKREMVSLIDFPPTLLDACGIEVPDQMQGRSLVPLLKGQADDWDQSVFIQISESHIGRSVRTPRWKYAMIAKEGLENEETESATEYIDAFLYDLESDPYELVNLVDLDSHVEILGKLREIMHRKMAEAGEAPSVIHPIQELRNGGQRIVVPNELETLDNCIDSPHRNGKINVGC